MANYAQIQRHIDKGLAIAGRKLGPPYTAYRINSSATGDFPSGWPVVGTNVLAMRRRINERKIESALEYAGTVWYDIIGGMAPYLLGDVFVCTDPPYVAGVSYGSGATAVPGGSEFEINSFALAWHSAVHRPTGARLDRRVQLFRPLGGPDTMTDGTLAWRQANDRSMPLILTAGVFAFGDPGQTASFVPCGMSSAARPGKGDNFPPSIPGMTGFTRYYGYLPYLPGYEPSEGDRLISEDGARYIIMNPYRQEEGVVGSQFALERTIAQVK